MKYIGKIQLCPSIYTALCFQRFFHVALKFWGIPERENERSPHLVARYLTPLLSAPLFVDNRSLPYFPLRSFSCYYYYYYVGGGGFFHFSTRGFPGFEGDIFWKTLWLYYNMISVASTADLSKDFYIDIASNVSKVRFLGTPTPCLTFNAW